jgi:hypothetical protein
VGQGEVLSVLFFSADGIKGYWVEMVAATVLFSMYSESRNNELLLGDIRTLREALMPPKT